MADLLTMDKVPALAREWLGPIPVGDPVLVVAEGGTGKGVAGAKFIQLVTTGSAWPGEPEDTWHEPGTVIIVAPEDDQHKDLRPRLDAVGADVRYVINFTRFPDGSAFEIPRDVPKLQKLIHDIADPKVAAYRHMPAVKLVILDPLTKIMGEKNNVSSRKGANLVLSPLLACAAETNVAMLVTHHTNWDGRANGSRALYDSVRAAWTIKRDPDEPDQRIIDLGSKTNITTGSRLKYRITTGTNGHPVAEFIDAEDAMARRIAEAGARAAIKRVLGDESAPPEAAPHRTARLLVRLDGAEERSYLGDSESMDAARDIAQADELAQGSKLVWVVKREGMETATRKLPNGSTVGYSAYALAPEVPAQRAPTLPVGEAPTMPTPACERPAQRAPEAGTDYRPRHRRPAAMA